MNFSSQCTTQGISAVLSGLALLTIPGLLLPLLGLTIDGGLLVVARMLGGILFALGTTLFAATAITDAQQQRKVAVGNGACDLVLTGVLIQATMVGNLETIGGYVLAALFGINFVTWLIVGMGVKDPE